MRSAPTIAAVCLALGVAGAATAQTTTNITITPTTPVAIPTVVAVPNDAAPGFSFGSFASGGGAKTDMYFPPTTLFGRNVTLGEIARMSYWTKSGSTHTVDPRDWYLAIYTEPYVGDASTSWYGVRIGSEPYFSANLDDPAGTWSNWSTDGAANTLRFFESTQGAPGANFGSYTDPDWDTFVGGSALGSGEPYAGQTVMYFSVQTGSAWAAGFTGQLDGLRIELTDGSVATVNFEAFGNIARDKDACKNGGWQTLVRANGTPFKNQGACVSYVNTGK